MRKHRSMIMMWKVKASTSDVKEAGRSLIICDFDGTITRADVGYELIKRFSDHGWEEIDRAYCEGTIGSKDAYTRIAALLKASQDEMIGYALACGSIDPHFEEFYVFCKKKNIDIVIVSDGLEFYIEAILKKYNIHDIEYLANLVIFHDNRAVSIEFPRSNDECDSCGNCKRNILRHYRLTYEGIIYIGNGYSDICPSQDADLVFAKEVLYDRCVETGRNCVYYENFRDIRTHLERTFPFFLPENTKKPSTGFIEV